MNELQLRKKEISDEELQIARLEQLKKELIRKKEQYYLDYFETERPDYTKLKDIPPFEYLSRDYSKTHPVHPLAKHSNLNAILIGDLIKELFERYEHKEVESLFHIEGFNYNDENEQDYNAYTPWIIIGNDRKNLINKDSKNILIPLDYLKEQSQGEYSIPFSLCDKTFYYTPYKNFINSSRFACELCFDTKGYEFIRDLIYNLAYYQKQHDITQMTKEQTREVYSKIYKR